MLDIGDSVAISSEAYRALRDARNAKIGQIIERGESLSEKGISYEEYSVYVGMTGSCPTRSVYDFLCYEGKSRDYFRSQALDIYDRWAGGEDFSIEELSKWLQYASSEYQVADFKRGLYEKANNLTSALTVAGITLGEDEKFDIRLSPHGRFVIEGIDDDERHQKIEDVVNDTLNSRIDDGRVFWERCLRLPGKSAESMKHDSQAIQSARDIGVAEKFLAENTDGVTLSDLYLDAEGRICGKLAEATRQKLNDIRDPKHNDEYQTFTEEEKFWAKNKWALQGALQSIKQYGVDSLPCPGFHFEFAGGKLNLVESR